MLQLNRLHRYFPQGGIFRGTRNGPPVLKVRALPAPTAGELANLMKPLPNLKVYPNVMYRGRPVPWAVALPHAKRYMLANPTKIPAVRSPKFPAAPFAPVVKNPSSSWTAANPKRSGAASDAKQQASSPPLGELIARQYKLLNTRLTDETRPKWTDADVVPGSIRELGKGEFNTVYSVEVMVDKGRVQAGVFKPLLQEEEGFVAFETGIPPENPQTLHRNLAAKKLANAVGFPGIVDVSAAVLTPPGAAGPRLGMLMSKAPGMPAFDMRALLTQSEVRRQSTELQWFDFLIGNGDRHSDNYFVSCHEDPQTGEKTYTVTGIDNDQCFGSKVRHPSDLTRYGFFGVKLPPVIDRDMARRIRNLTRFDLGELLGPNLTAEEVDAAKERLTVLKAHVDELERTGNIIDPHKWGSLGEKEKLFTSQNSYWKRDSDPSPVQVQW